VSLARVGLVIYPAAPCACLQTIDADLAD